MNIFTDDDHPSSRAGEMINEQIMQEMSKLLN